MKANEAVREVMDRRGVGTNALASRMGNKPPRLVSDRLRMENISMDKLLEMLRVMDYRVIVVPRESGVPKDGIVIE
jgi:hypothetical protein